MDLGSTGPDQGDAEIYLDGRLVRKINTHGAARVTGRELFAVTGLRHGEHTIRVVKASGEVLRHDVFRYQQK